MYAEFAGYMNTAQIMGLVEHSGIKEGLTREEAADLIYKALNRPMMFLKDPDPNVEHSGYDAYVADGTYGYEYITLYTTFFEKTDE